MSSAATVEIGTGIGPDLYDTFHVDDQFETVLTTQPWLHVNLDGHVCVGDFGKTRARIHELGLFIAHAEIVMRNTTAVVKLRIGRMTQGVHHAANPDYYGPTAPIHVPSNDPGTPVIHG